MRLASAMLILSAVGFVSADDAKKDDADSFKGKWSAVSMSVNGQALPEDVIKSLKMTFDDKSYTLTTGDTTNEEGSYTVDTSKSPKTIDLDIKKGDDAGKQQLGLFKIEGSKLTFLFGLPGSNERPKSFKVEEGSPTVEIVLEKVKP
jgi:uncharacterized protein (TIGR03067 family)